MHTFHCVIRDKYPIEALQLNSHINSACCGTPDWQKMMDFSGSKPTASRAASICFLKTASLRGSCFTVTAWRSTMENNRVVPSSASFCSLTHWRNAPR